MSATLNKSPLKPLIREDALEISFMADFTDRAAYEKVELEKKQRDGDDEGTRTYFIERESEELEMCDFDIAP